MAYTKFATSEPWTKASGARLNQLGDELQEQINVLNNKKYLSTYEGVDLRNVNTKPSDYSLGLYTNSLKASSAVGLAEYGIWANIIGYNSWADITAGVNEIAFINGIVLTRQSLDANTWQPWQQIATTTKTSFSCTANTGYTVLTQYCYTLNGEFFITLQIKKTDDTSFPLGEYTIFTLPFSTSRIYVGSVMTYKSGWVQSASAYTSLNECKVSVVADGITMLFITLKGAI